MDWGCCAQILEERTLLGFVSGSKAWDQDNNPTNTVPLRDLKVTITLVENDSGQALSSFLTRISAQG